MAHRMDQVQNELRLAIRDIDGDAAYLSRLLVRSHPNAEHLETELEKCFNDIRRYISVSRTVRNHFKFMQSDDPFKNAGAGEKVILLTDVRHSATTVKEILLRVGTRYVLTERIYALQASSARVSAKRYEEWLARDGGSHKIGPINMTIETELRLLIQVIKQTEHLLAEAKKDLKKESPKDHPREMENFNKLQQLLKEQTEEIRTVRTKLSSLENFVTNGDQYVAQEKEQDQAESLPSQEKDRELTDDEHLSKLIEETKDEGGPVSVVVQCSSKRTTHTREFENQRRWIESMEYALKRFPYRKLAAYSDGVEPQRPCVFCGAQSAHFSDSCPIVQDARTRNQIVHDSKLCRLCLEQCGNRCGLKNRECWYCVRVYNTPFEDLVPRDGHHKALCPIPEAKDQMHRRLEDALREWQGMERGNRWGGRECRGWSTPRATAKWN